MRNIVGILGLFILSSSVGAFAAEPVFKIETASEITNGANNRGIIEIGYRGFDGEEKFRYFSIQAEVGSSSNSSGIFDYANIRLVPVSVEIFKNARITFGATRLMIDQNLGLDGAFSINAAGIDLSSEYGVDYKVYNRFVVSVLGIARATVWGSTGEMTTSWLDFDFSQGVRSGQFFVETSVQGQYLNNGVSFGELSARAGYEIAPEKVYLALESGLRTVSTHTVEHNYQFIRLVLGTKL